ncbi:MAG: NAD(+) diphosphatase [Actinomycetota bacterium]|nr:NAD(+) diphosphatase [Actinomycetota bacterium]
MAPPADKVGARRWYVVRTNELLVAEDGRPIRGTEPAVASAEAPLYIGAFDGDDCWAIGAAAQTQAPGGHRWAPLRALGLEWPVEEWTVAGRAVQLVEWQRTSVYCGRCATATGAAAGERAMSCPACGLLAYPRLAPAVIVLVRKGRDALLAHGRGFPPRMYSALAGFVEVGETLEETVHREVKEEVGVTLDEVRYVGSQPWPFPHSLMLGFNASWAAGEINVDGVEVLDAGWYHPERLPAIPPAMSIARRLIDEWLADPG